MQRSQKNRVNNQSHSITPSVPFSIFPPSICFDSYLPSPLLLHPYNPLALFLPVFLHLRDIFNMGNRLSLFKLLTHLTPPITPTYGPWLMSLPVWVMKMPLCQITLRQSHTLSYSGAGCVFVSSLVQVWTLKLDHITDIFMIFEFWFNTFCPLYFKYYHFYFAYFTHLLFCSRRRKHA